MKKSSTLFLAVLIVVSVAGQHADLHPVNTGRQEMQLVVPGQVHFESHKYFLHSLPKQAALMENHESGRLLYEGGSKSGKLHGLWKSWYADGSLCDSGMLVKGLPHGEWKHWDPQGVLIAVRNYDAGKYQRIKNELIRYNPRRINLPIVVQYKKNKSQVLNSLSSLYSFPGSEANHAIHSLRQLVISNVTTGTAYHPVFEQNLHHGLFVNFYNDGSVKDSGHYENGLREGVWTHHEQHNGYWQGAYKHGAKVSEWKYYHPGGKLRLIHFYDKHGRLTREKKFR